MFKIENKTIKINRGDIGTITLTIPDHIFQKGDVITLGVYTKKGLQKESKLLKNVVVEEATASVDIPLTKEDTTIDEIQNKPITYWYEIQLNHEQTVVGYDDESTADFILYPEGSDIK